MGEKYFFVKFGINFAPKWIDFQSWICFFFVRLLDYNLPTLCQLIKIEDMPVRLPSISIQFSYFFFCSNDKTWIKLIGFMILIQLVVP